MSPKTKLIVRLVFWSAFLIATPIVARTLWLRADPLRNHPVLAPWWLQRQVDRLASTRRATAIDAWNELERCFLSKWSAYDWVVWRVKEDIWKKSDPPIHFHLSRSGARYHAADAPPSRDCRTVTEALMAMLHQEGTRRSNFAGDWRKWWDDNWTAYPNRHLSAKPSGPEDPQRRAGR